MSYPHIYIHTNIYRAYTEHILVYNNNSDRENTMIHMVIIRHNNVYYIMYMCLYNFIHLYVFIHVYAVYAVYIYMFDYVCRYESYKKFVWSSGTPIFMAIICPNH